MNSEMCMVFIVQTILSKANAKQFYYALLQQLNQIFRVAALFSVFHAIPYYFFDFNGLQ